MAALLYIFSLSLFLMALSSCNENNITVKTISFPTSNINIVAIDISYKKLFTADNIKSYDVDSDNIYILQNNNITICDRLSKQLSTVEIPDNTLNNSILVTSKSKYIICGYPFILCVENGIVSRVPNYLSILYLAYYDCRLFTVANFNSLLFKRGDILIFDEDLKYMERLEGPLNKYNLNQSYINQLNLFASDGVIYGYNSKLLPEIFKYDIYDYNCSIVYIKNRWMSKNGATNYLSMLEKPIESQSGKYTLKDVNVIGKRFFSLAQDEKYMYILTFNENGIMEKAYRIVKEESTLIDNMKIVKRDDFYEIYVIRIQEECEILCGILPI